MEIIKQQRALNKAALTLKMGKVIVCPTDTVYGFLADAGSKKAVNKIFKIKKRPKSKSLSIFVKDIKMAKTLSFTDKNQENFLKKNWPGKITIVLKRKTEIKIYGIAKSTIAMRIPKYKFLNNLLKKINRPLVQTSVNISGEPFLTNVRDIQEKFEKKKLQPDLIVDAGFLKNKPSRIIDLTGKNEKILR